MTEYGNPSASDPQNYKAVLERRRSIILAIVAKTAPENSTLKKILLNAFLVTVNCWLVDSLKMNIGRLAFVT